MPKYKMTDLALVARITKDLHALAQLHPAEAVWLRWHGNGVLWLSTCPKYAVPAKPVGRPPVSKYSKFEWRNGDLYGKIDGREGMHLHQPWQYSKVIPQIKRELLALEGCPFTEATWPTETVATLPAITK